MSRFGNVILLTLMLVLTGHIFTAQPDTSANHPYYVFIEQISAQAGDKTTATTLRFVDLITGQENVVDVVGERFTLAGHSVIYWDTRLQQVRVISPDGTIRNHPFIQADGGAFSVDWVISRDGKLSAWSLAFRDGDRLSSAIYMASSTDENIRELVRDDNRTDGLRLVPVALSVDQNRLYFDYLLDGLQDLTLFPQYAALSYVDLETGESGFLPDEPGDFTGAGFGGGYFVRLNLALSNVGFDLSVFDMHRDRNWQLSSVDAPEFTQAGDVLVSPDGRFAVYSLLRIVGVEDGVQEIETLLVLADLTANTQEIIGEARDRLLRPVEWANDNERVLLADFTDNITYELDTETERLTETMNQVYLGTLYLPDA